MRDQRCISRCHRRSFVRAKRKGKTHSSVVCPFSLLHTPDVWEEGLDSPREIETRAIFQFEIVPSNCSLSKAATQTHDNFNANYTEGSSGMFPFKKIYIL